MPLHLHQPLGGLRNQHWNDARRPARSCCPCTAWVVLSCWSCRSKLIQVDPSPGQGDHKMNLRYLSTTCNLTSPGCSRIQVAVGFEESASEVCFSCISGRSNDLAAFQSNPCCPFQSPQQRKCDKCSRGLYWNLLNLYWIVFNCIELSLYSVSLSLFPWNISCLWELLREWMRRWCGRFGLLRAAQIWPQRYPAAPQNRSSLEPFSPLCPTWDQDCQNVQNMSNGYGDLVTLKAFTYQYWLDLHQHAAKRQQLWVLSLCQFRVSMNVEAPKISGHSKDGLGILCHWKRIATIMSEAYSRF